MDPKQIVGLAFKISIFALLFSFGLKAHLADVLYLVRRPGLFVRSVLAVFVIMPLVAYGLNRIFDFQPTVTIALMALALAPLPPILPMKTSKVGPDNAYGLSLMVWSALLAIVSIPLALSILRSTTGLDLGMAPSAIVPFVLKGILVPLVAGLLIRRFLPSIAMQLAKPVTLIGTVLILLAVVALLWRVFPMLGALIGEGALLAGALFIVIGLLVGHFLGAPDPDQSSILAVATASRHPALAIAIASTNFPDQRFGGTILLFLLVNAVIGGIYLKWRKRRAAPAVAKA